MRYCRLLHRIWTEESVDHDGPRYQYQGLRVNPKPIQTPLEVWLGGAAPAELRRVGRLGDGWLPSFCTPEVACGGGWVEINREATAHGREMDDGHFGALVSYTHDDLSETTLELLNRRAPGIDPREIIPVGWDGLRVQIEKFIEIGASKSWRSLSVSRKIGAPNSKVWQALSCRYRIDNAVTRPPDQARRA